LFDAIKKHDEFYKIDIINEQSKADRQELYLVFEEVITVKNVYSNNEIDQAITVIFAKRKFRAIYGCYESVLEMAGRGSKSVFTGWISFPSQQEKITKISKETDFSDVKGMVKVRIYNKVGDKISRRKNTTIRTGYIIIEDEDRHQLLEKLHDAFRRFRLEVK